jgi:ABC-2 type transport system ATP-binding protein
VRPETISEPVVALAGVSRNFGDRPALTELTLSVQHGSIAVLLGPNGAGKTTAIRVVTGALEATLGSVRVFGLDPRHDGEQIRRRCGVVAAKPALYDRLSGRDNLKFSAELYGLNLKHAPIEASAERFGIAGSLDELVGGFSTGMKTRLALARAVLHDPDLLLLDEPTSGLDPESSVAVLDLVKAFARDGKTVLLCTHLLLEAEGLADQIVVMDAGRCIESGAPAELMARYWPDPEVVVRVDGVVDVAVLRGLPGVSGVEQLTDGSLRFGLETHGTVPELVAELCRRHLRIQGVVPYEPSLEDLYFASRKVVRGEMTAVRGDRTVAVQQGTAA